MSEREKDSKVIHKITFWLGIIALVFGVFGFFVSSMRVLFKPSDYFLIATVLLLIALDAKSGSTLLG